MERSTQTGAFRRMVLAAVIPLALVAAACSSGDGGGSTAGPAATAPEPPPVDGGRLAFGLQGESDGWLAQASRWSPAGQTVARAIFDPLVVAGDDGAIHPYLLESIKPVGTDVKQWDLTARPGVTFHDGTPFDADAMVVNLKAFKASLLTSNAFTPIVDVAKVDDRTVRLTSNVPWATLPSLFLTQAGYFAAPSQVQANDTQKPIGTGPFRFESWTPQSTLKVKKNPTYWQKGLPHLDAIDFKPIPDVDSRRKAVDAGDIDAYHSNLSADIVRLQGGDLPHDTGVIFSGPIGSDVYEGVFNTQTGVFADKDLRLAVIRATDRKALVDTLFDGKMAIADGPYGKGSGWDVPGDFPGFDLAAAKQAVDRWKGAHGGQPPAFSLTFVNTNEDTQIAQLLQQQWQAAGFDVKLEGFDEAKFTSVLVSGKFELLTFKFPQTADPDGQYPFWSNDTVGEPGAISLNFARFRSDAVQQALLAGRATDARAARQDAYSKVFKEWSAQGAYLWFFFPRWALVHNTRVHGLDKVKAPDGTALPPLGNGAPFFTTAWMQL